MEILLTDHLPGRTVKTQDGKEYLWFSGTDYLGMGHNEDFRRLIIEGTKAYGTHFGSSRNNSLRLKIYEDAEIRFAAFVRSSSALLISSGMWAGQLLMREIESIVTNSLNPQSIQYHYAPKVHPAIIGNSFETSTLNWSDWAANVVETIKSSNGNVAHIVCSDAAGSPFVQQFDFSVFNQITAPEKVWLIIDESHSLGVCGNQGNGICETLSEAIRLRTIFVSSLNKALGIPAGMIWGSSVVTDLIRKSPWFAGASPSAPAYIYAFEQLLEAGIYSRELRKLKENLAYFSQIFPERGHFQSIPDYPVFCNTSSDLFEYLLQNKIMVSCFAYPSPTDTPVTRLAISSVHQKEDLNRLAEVCNAFFGL